MCISADLKSTKYKPHNWFGVGHNYADDSLNNNLHDLKEFVQIKDAQGGHLLEKQYSLHLIEKSFVTRI
jgi:hypothetical protein